jgi:hypothetical protein
MKVPFTSLSALVALSALLDLALKDLIGPRRVVRLEC